MNTFFTRMAVTLPAIMFFVLSVMTPSEILASEPAIDPAATEILQQTTEYLGNLSQFSVETQNTMEDVYGSGHRIDLDVSAKVIVSRPNKIRSERKGDLVDQIFYYNGKSMTLFSPILNVFSTVDAPDTFYGLFKYLYVKIGLGLPLSDLVYSNAFPLLMEDVTFAKFLGTTHIEGVKCNHLLFSRPGVDFQMWVTDGGQPLPLKYVVTDTSTQARASVSTIFSDWDLSPSVEDTQFTFEPPKDAQEIEFL